MEKFRWAYIGSGAIARKTAAEITKAGHVITACYSRSFENAAKFTEKYGGQPYGDLSSMLSRADIDGVYVCTVNSLHFEHAAAAIRAGKNVLLEKPVTLNADDAVRLFELAAGHNVYLAEAMWTWFNPVANKVKEWVSGGRIGAVKKIDMSLELNLLWFKGRRGRLVDPDGGGALLDLGVYPVTYCYRLLGYPEKTECKFNMDAGVDLSEDITLRYPGGAVCNIRVALNRLRPEKAVICGDAGKITVPRFHPAKKAVLDAGGREVFRGGGNYLTEFNAVASEIRQGLKTSKFVPPESTISVMKILDECRAVN